MKKLLLIIAILISGMGLFAQNVGDETIIDYEGYSLKFTVTSVNPNECEVKYGVRPTKETTVAIPSTVIIGGTGVSVTSIGKSAFLGCDNLTIIEIPNSVTSIGYEAFLDCDNLTIIEIPNSVTSIGYEAFMSCDKLTNIEIPNSVISIDDDAFYYCDNLTNIIFEKNSQLISIGDRTFQSCHSLKSIEIPSSVTSIGNDVFLACSSLTSISVESGNIVYDSRNNCNAIIETSNNTLIAGCHNTIIPNTVISIGDSAFFGCDNLTSIEIPNTVISIGESAFISCI